MVEIPIITIVVTAVLLKITNLICKFFDMNVYIKYKNVYYYRIYVFDVLVSLTSITEGIDVNKTSTSKECDAFPYWYFLNYTFKFQPNVCNRCLIY